MCSTVQGDALLCAAAVCYLGAFPPPRRQELLEKWQDLLAGRRVPLGPDDVRRALEQELPCPGPAPTTPGPPLLPVHPDFSLLALLSCEREQRAWDRDRKLQDPASRQAAALLHAAARICPRRWPLLLDPDQQALTWLSTVPRAKDGESGQPPQWAWLGLGGWCRSWESHPDPLPSPTQLQPHSCMRGRRGLGWGSEQVSAALQMRPVPTRTCGWRPQSPAVPPSPRSRRCRCCRRWTPVWRRVSGQPPAAVRLSGTPGTGRGAGGTRGDARPLPRSARPAAARGEEPGQPHPPAPAAEGGGPGAGTG